MLNRLISNLPFNPSLIEELSFYSRRLRQEQSIRRLGFFMIVLSLIVQIVAASIPAERSLASSDNDIIRGGVKNKQQLLAAWDNPGTQVADIYGKFGLTRNDIANLPNKPNARIKSNASNFWSVGRSPLTGYSDISQLYKNKDIAIKTAGPTVYLRPLKAWDTNVAYSVYEAFRGRNSTTGETFWIIADCGNYTQNGPGRLPPPKLQIRKTIVGNRHTTKPGEMIRFRIEYRNQQPDSLAEDVKIFDNLQKEKFDIISPDSLPIGRNNRAEIDVGNLRYTDNSHVFDIAVRAKDNLRHGARICNTARITASNASTVSAGSIPDTCIHIARTSAPAPQTASLNTASRTAAAINTPTVTSSNQPPGLSKKVTNVTQNLNSETALQSQVRPNDVIEYSLMTYNGRSADITNYEIRDFIGDVLDYSDLDLNYLSQQGGKYDQESKTVVWTNQTLPAGKETVKKFRVKVKNPVPATNSPSNLSTNFDCKISNEYGNETTMNLQCPVAKSIETLPNTGPGTAIAITFGLTSISGYFLARNGLLSKEIFILRRNYASAGGNK